MLPPVLEIHVVWHPQDVPGRTIAEELVNHFHGTVFSGLIGGAVEVYARSIGWEAQTDAPRPILFSDSPQFRAAQFVAIVPIIGNELAVAVQNTASPWHTYLRAILDTQAASPDRIRLFPYLLDQGASTDTTVGQMLGAFQNIGGNPAASGDTPERCRCRDLTQGIVQFLGKQRLTVFISHTKRSSPVEGERVDSLIATVRGVIANTRLNEFFDAHDLQPGEDWSGELRARAASSALLAIRTDLYPSRVWCQREVLTAKRAGMPVIIMDALGDAEERGSFLMDHVPRVPARVEHDQWRRGDIYRALGLLVDECAKRALWFRQKELAEHEKITGVSWWAPHAPEPVTLTHWLAAAKREAALPSPGKRLVVLHPDPPLGEDEKAALQEILVLAGLDNPLDVLTPRLLAARGG